MNTSEMMNPTMKTLLLPILLLLSLAFVSHSAPLHTKSKWIVDSVNGERVKLKCLNWAGHMEAMLPEGLHKRPLPAIAKHVSLMGFNCIRLTYATYMYTRHSHLTVSQSLQNVGYDKVIEGMKINNPDLLNLTLIDAQKTVIEVLGFHGVMVIIDNHLSKPMWCCGNEDGNGFFGDKFFDPKEWLEGWDMVARRYKDTHMVVGMSLRNELRGPRQNVTNWTKYVQMGALTVHKANPHVLVFVSGFDYDLHFKPLKTKPLALHLNHKLVYEAHHYSFSSGGRNKWLNEPINQVCKSLIEELNNNTMFLREDRFHPAPLVITEVGINENLDNRADNLFWSCYLAYLADADLDWALWAMQGSYYRRKGQDDNDESYGLLDGTWVTLRSPEFYERLQLIQQMHQDLNAKPSTEKILYHPLSGRCVRVDKDQVHPSDCHGPDRWTHAGDMTPIQLVGTNKCLRAGEEGLPVTVSTRCKNAQTTWKSVAGGMFQIAVEDDNGNNMCLDWDPNYSTRIVTNKCICADPNDTKCLDDPQSQWFQLISTNAE